MQVKLSSARALKESIVRGEGRAVAQSHGIRSSGLPRGVALGIAVTRPGHYGIAVRLRETNAAVKDYVSYVVDAAFDEVVVRVTGPIRPLVARPLLRRGDTIAHTDGGRGTLGCFVRCASTSAVGVLSNNHVLANENTASRGDAIVRVASIEEGQTSRDVIGTLDRFVRLHADSPNRVDAAFAVLADRADVHEPIDVRGVGDPAEHDIVEKIGSATGHTQGWIDAFELDGVLVEYSRLGTLSFDGVVEVRGTGAPFSGPGDSGSVIVADNGHAVALLFAGTDDDDPLTYGNRFADVLRDLDAHLLTGPTE